MTVRLPHTLRSDARDNRELILAAAFTDEMRACHDIVGEGLADPDPWHGFCLVIERICELHARNRGFTAAFISAYPRAMDFAADREYALHSLAGLARRAKEAGRLRPDFVLDDLILVLMANSGIRAASPAAAVASSRRYAALAIQAFQASPAGLTAAARSQASPRGIDRLTPPHPGGPPPGRGRCRNPARR